MIRKPFQLLLVTVCVAGCTGSATPSPTARPTEPPPTVGPPTVTAINEDFPDDCVITLITEHDDVVEVTLTNIAYEEDLHNGPEEFSVTGGTGDTMRLL